MTKYSMFIVNLLEDIVVSRSKDVFLARAQTGKRNLLGILWRFFVRSQSDSDPEFIWRFLILTESSSRDDPQPLHVGSLSLTMQYRWYSGAPSQREQDVPWAEIDWSS